MKKFWNKIQKVFAIHIVNGSSNQETPSQNNGDFVPLVWEIEKLRKREGGCTMNELIANIKRDFEGIESIKHRTKNYH